MKKLFIVVLTCFINISIFTNENIVEVTTHYSKPINQEEINITLDNSNQYVQILINGEIFNFEIVTIAFTGETFIDQKIDKSIKNLKNKILILEVSLPEGLPFKKIRWEDKDGNKFEHLIIDQSNPIDGKQEKKSYLIK